MEKDSGTHDDYRMMHMEDFEGVVDVYMFDASLELRLFGVKSTEQSPVTDVSVPEITRNY